MNKYQINYIKEQQMKKIFVIPSIKKRDNIDNSIFTELETIYNPNLLGMETIFKSNLADITMPNDFLEDTAMIKLIREYGSDVVMIYMYLHSKMSQEGYKIKWDEIQIDVLSASISGVYKVSSDSFKKIIIAMIQNKLLYVIKDSTNTKWLTSVYQVFAYERVAAKRLRDRIAKRNTNLKKTDKIKTQCSIPSFEEEMDADVQSKEIQEMHEEFTIENPEEFFGTTQEESTQNCESEVKENGVNDTEQEEENIYF